MPAQPRLLSGASFDTSRLQNMVSITPAEHTDHLLVANLRTGHHDAWTAFVARFRPMLEAYARKVNIPRSEWSQCITELLSDEASRLMNVEAAVPQRLDAYLLRAVRNKYLYMKRSAVTRDRIHQEASDRHSGEWIVPTTCSDDARRASAGPDAPGPEMSEALARLAADLDADITDEERSLLMWVSEGVPRAHIAKWLGVTPEACAKRVWRLCRRLQSKAMEQSQTYAIGEQKEIARFLRRAASE